MLSRATQGISAALVSPAALALLGEEFSDGARRARAFGFWAASGSAAGCGSVAGVYSMAQQVGTAIGLAAFTITAVAYTHGSVHVTDRLHGLQVATLDTAALALGAAVFAALALPRRTPHGSPSHVDSLVR